MNCSVSAKIQPITIKTSQSMFGLRTTLVMILISIVICSNDRIANKKPALKKK